MLLSDAMTKSIRAPFKPDGNLPSASRSWSKKLFTSAAPSCALILATSPAKTDLGLSTISSTHSASVASWYCWYTEAESNMNDL